MKKNIVFILVCVAFVMTSCVKEHTCECTFTDSAPAPAVAEPTRTTETIITGRKGDAETTCETNSKIEGYYETKCEIK